MYDAGYRQQVNVDFRQKPFELWKRALVVMVGCFISPDSDTVPGAIYSEQSE